MFDEIYYRKIYGYVNNSEKDFPNKEVYKVKRCKVKTQIKLKNVDQYALEGDYIFQQVTSKGRPIGQPFVVSVEEFYKHYEQI